MMVVHPVYPVILTISNQRINSFRSSKIDFPPKNNEIRYRMLVLFENFLFRASSFTGMGTYVLHLISSIKPTITQLQISYLPITFVTSDEELKLNRLPARENAFFSIEICSSFNKAVKFCRKVLLTLIPNTSILATLKMEFISKSIITQFDYE